MSPHDIIRVDLGTGITLFWEIKAAIGGALNVEGLVHLRPLTHKPSPYGTTLVPQQLLDVAVDDSSHINHYRRVDTHHPPLADEVKKENP